MSKDTIVTNATAHMGRLLKRLAREIDQEASARVATMSQRELMAEGCRLMAAYWKDAASSCYEEIDRDDCLAIARQADSFAEHILKGGDYGNG